MGDSVRLRPSRFAGVLFALAAIFALGTLLVAVSAAPAAAQGFGWFGGLFGEGGGGEPERPQRPAFPGYNYGYSRAPDTSVPRHRARRHPVEQTQKEQPQKDQVQRAQTQKGQSQRAQVQKEAPAPKEKTPPKNATAFVYVFGDSLGQVLATGLDDALTDRQDVGVIHKARGSSGLVTTDFYDWPKAVDTLLAGKDKIDVAVMMIGSNDRQPIREEGKTYEPGSDEWNAIYRKRVLAFDGAFQKKGIPLIWVGVPITKNGQFADDMAAFNDIYREAAAKTGATYVDTWEAFSDDNGEFNAFGPDINGQMVRLRSADGIHFTRAGARKLAHFVETHVRRDLDGKAPVPVLPTTAVPDADASAGKPTVVQPRVAAKPDAGPINNLNQTPTASNGQLSTPTGYHGAGHGDTLVEDSLVKGQSQAAPTGRADDLRWPATGAKAP